MLLRVVDADARCPADCSWIDADHAAGVRVEAELRVRVADLADRLAHDARDVHVRRSCVISPATMTMPVVTSVSHATRPVGSSREDRVEDGVGDLVGELVGMSLGDGFGGEQVPAAAMTAGV